MKKFLTVLLVIAVMFTFSFGSAFAVTDFDGKNYQAMQEGDYYKDGTVTHGLAGASGITDAERDAYVAELEKAVKTLDDDATYLTKKYCECYKLCKRSIGGCKSSNNFNRIKSD